MEASNTVLLWIHQFAKVRPFHYLYVSLNVVANQPKMNITKVAHLHGHKDAIYDFVVDHKEGYIYSVGADGYVIQWDIPNPSDGVMLMQAGEALYSVYKFGDRLMVGSRSGKVYEVDLISHSLIRSEKVHKGGVFFVRESFSGGGDGCLYVPSLKQNIQLSKNSLRCIATRSHTIYIGASDSCIYELDSDTYEVLGVLKGHTNSVFSLHVNDNNTLLSTGRDAHIIVHDLTIKKEVFRVPAHRYQVKHLSSNSQFILSCSMDKTIKVWDDRLNLLKVIDYERYQGHTNCINKTAWVDENMFVSCSDDRSIVFWKVEIMD